MAALTPATIALGNQGSYNSYLNTGRGSKRRSAKGGGYIMRGGRHRRRRGRGIMTLARKAKAIKNTLKGTGIMQIARSAKAVKGLFKGRGIMQLARMGKAASRAFR
jgi:hypothetical protein